MKKFAVVATALFFAISSSSFSASAATKKPTPKPTIKVTAKAKPTAKKSSKATAKATANATSKATAKTTASSTSTTKATTPVKKKVVVKKKRKPRKKVRVSPSPKAAWPPAGFSQSGEVFAKVPTSKELVGIISAKTSLGSAVKDCLKYVCGAVQVGAETGCTWWEVSSKVLGKDNELLGNLTTISGASAAQELKTILLISPELLETIGRVSGISVTCHHEDKEADTPPVTYKKAN